MEAITYVKVSVGAAGGIRPWLAAKSPPRLVRPRLVRGQAGPPTAGAQR